MKVFIGSSIVVILLCIGIWLMLSPSFKKIGDTAKRIKEKLGGDEDGNGK
ncbi:hypothetical protein [Peribacillus glennii]|nr:hypothetical protein [Peribacillus glennii]